MARSDRENLDRGAARGSLTGWVLLGFIMLFVIYVRVRLLEVPLERDEGEYAYMGQLLLQGIPPYSEAYNMKFPGTYLVYAVIMYLFGETTQGIHIGFMILNCTTVLLIFLLARRIVNGPGAIVASAIYAVLSLSPSVLGFAAHATHLVAMAAVAGALLLFAAVEKEGPHLYFSSGTMFGLALLMKQPGFFFILFGAAYIICCHSSPRAVHSVRRSLGDLACFLCGSLFPLLAVFVWLYASGVFDRFWFWTIEYASKYVSQIPASVALGNLVSNLRSVADGFSILWVVSVLGLFVMFFHPGLKVRKVFVILFVVFSFLTTCPGFYFRKHYFVTLLPPVAILVGVVVDFLDTEITTFSKSPYLRAAGLGIPVVVILLGIADQSGYFFCEDPVRVSKQFYVNRPFAESVEIAKFIEAGSSVTDEIAVLGSEPQICFYSRRHSATGYIYVYGLMESHEYRLKMQKEMISEIEASRPRFMVVVNVATSWLTNSESEQHIFRWLDDYLQRDYVLVGVADMIAPEVTVYKWRADAGQYVVRSPYHVLVFERR